MRPYNIEIFDRSMNFVANTITETVKYKSDYLDSEKYKISLVGVSGIPTNSFIHITRDDEDYVGIVSQTDDKADGTVSVTVSEIPSLFDVDILVDVNDMSNYTLEEYIEKWIKELFIEGDTSMALPFEIVVSSTTSDWVIDYDVKNEPREDETEPTVLVAEMNLYDDIILPAFTQYQIRLDYSVNLNTRRITIDIGKNESDEIVIESDLPNIISKSVVIKKANRQTNKVIVYNSEDYTESITYYLHSDDSFDTEDTDRIIPVEYKLLDAKEERDEDVVTKTFEEAAHEKAESTFSKNKYTNLIELEILNDDDLINPTHLKIGQVVSVISEGIAYNSILTGREVNNTTTLIFGTLRLELTKIMKGRA